MVMLEGYRLRATIKSGVSRRSRLIVARNGAQARCTVET